MYTEDSINTLPDLMYSILIMSRAHEESALKGSRVAAAWEDKRHRAITENHKLTHKRPAWLVLNEANGRQIYTVLPEQAELVQRMFQMSINGHGSTSIAKQLNQEKVPTWRGGDGWHPAHIRKLLHSPNVYGEYVPGKMVDKKRTLLEPIPDYYPAIISKDVFFQAQHAIKQRTHKGGRPSGIVNLFSALLRCFRCDGPVVRLIRGNGKKHVFVCDNGRQGRGDCRYKPWDILDFEQRVLTCVREVDLSFVLGSEQSERVDVLHMQLVGSQGMLVEVEGRLSRLIELWEQGVHVPSVVERIKNLEAEKQSLSERCAMIEKEYDAQREAMETAESKQQSVIELMNVIHDGDVRLKLKQQLRGLVERIECDLVKKQMIVWYIGQRPRMRPICPDVSPKMFKLQRAP